MYSAFIALIIVCLILSAFFSGSETAFISLQRLRLQQLVDSKARGARIVAGMLERPERLLSTILLGNTLVNTTASALVTLMVVATLGEKYGTLIATIGMTIILLIFGETVPKTVASHYAEKLAFLSSRPMQFISSIFSPFVWVLSWIASVFSRMLGERKTGPLLVSEDEIKTMISVGEKEGVLEKGAADMLHNVFDAGNKTAREVMVPRLDVVAVPKGATVSTFLDAYGRSPVSRFPVYWDTLDKVVGILAIKDVMMGLASGRVNNESPVDVLVRPAYFVPYTKLVSELMVEMRQKNYHLAVVVDEYGGTAGIVSLSTLVKEIIGPVQDELGVLDKEYEVLDERTVQTVGSMHVEDVNRETGLSLPLSDDYETVAGMIMKITGRIPRQGETLRYKGLKILIARMQGTKIEEVLITREGRGEAI